MKIVIYFWNVDWKNKKMHDFLFICPSFLERKRGIHTKRCNLCCHEPERTLFSVKKHDILLKNMTTLLILQVKVGLSAVWGDDMKSSFF
ncbi:hypothetical protein VL07_15940 [Bacillus safensis]|nr:hypothetical protein VL07_15940 [Bacillus safensis]KMN79766.1 hypothetical protein VK99_08970 [Bacillus safensis]